MPALVTVKVESRSSSGWSDPARAPSASRRSSASISAIERRSQPRTTGTTRPASVSTATPRSYRSSRTMSSSSIRALSSGKFHQRRSCGLQRRGDEQLAVDACEVALLDERHRGDLAVRALDLLDDGAPDATHRDPAPLGRCDRSVNVGGLGHAPTRTRAANRREVHGEITSKPVQRGRTSSGSEPTTATIGSVGSGSSTGGAATRVKELLSARADHREGGADSGELSFARDDAQDDPGHGRADLDGRLVGLNLDDRLVLVDGLALTNEPARDLAFGQPITEIRQRERVRHGEQSSGSVRREPHPGEAVESAEASPMSAPSGRHDAPGSPPPSDHRCLRRRPVLASARRTGARSCRDHGP